MVEGPGRAFAIVPPPFIPDGWLPPRTRASRPPDFASRAALATIPDPGEGTVAYTYEELKHKTVGELREIAKTVEQHEAVQGYSQMNKDHLLPALCKALGIDTHLHHAVTGVDKVALKAKIRELKKQRAAALEAHDHETLKSVRRHIHHLNRQIRAHVS
jgi:hypothetical protein